MNTNQEGPGVKLKMGGSGIVTPPEAVPEAPTERTPEPPDQKVG